MTIFISYRRDDALAIAGRIDDHLRAAFGQHDVYRDLESIPAGVDFVTHLRSALSDCDLCVVIVGPRWASTRLHEPQDFVRMELETVLSRRVTIIPVLVEGAHMPNPDELPEHLRPLLSRQALHVDSGIDFRANVERLVGDIRTDRAHNDHFGVAARQRSSRRRKIALSCVVLSIAVGGAVVTSAIQASNAASQQKVGAAWSNLSACVIGDPLKPGENVVWRARSAHLAQVHTMTMWPSSCVTYSQALSDLLHSEGRGLEVNGLHDETVAFSNALTAPNVSLSDLVHPLRKLWSAAAAEGIPFDVPASDQVPRPPKGEVALTIESLKQHTPLSADVVLHGLHFDELQGDTTHVLIADDSRTSPPILCTFLNDGRAAQCKNLTGELATQKGLDLVGTTARDAAPLVFAGTRGSSGIYRSDSGALVTRLEANSAFSGATGGYVAISSYSTNDHGCDVVEQDGPDLPARTTHIKPSAFGPNVAIINRTAILWNRFFVTAGPPDVPNHLFMTQLPLSQPVKFIDQGEFNWTNGELGGCLTEGTLVVRDGVERGLLSFRLGDKYSQPVYAKMLDGHFSCRGGEAFITQKNGQLRCTPSGCGEIQTPDLGFLDERHYPSKPETTDVVALGNDMLAVWVAGDLGGLRYRLAPADRMGTTNDSVIYDDRLSDLDFNVASNLFAVQVQARPNWAVALLVTSAGVHAIRLDPSGQRELVEVRR